MVGVAGKSQACHDCRRRRVKCDFGRPTCQRCAKANIKCGGYEKNLVFVNRTPQNVSLTAVSVLSEKAQIAKSEPRIPQTAEPEMDVLVTEVFDASQSGINFRRRAVELIKTIYLPQGMQEDQKPGHTVYSWIYSIPDLHGESRALDISLLTLCVALLYSSGIGNASLSQGLQLYNDAISQLCADLENPDTKVCEETLGTIVVLSTCELFLCTVDSGWRAHAGGISELLRLRCSQVQNSSFMWQHLVSRLRTICILDALTNRRATFLSAIEWKDVICIRTETKDYFEALMEIIADVPILLEESDILITTPRKDVMFQWGSNLIRSIASALTKLYFWHEDLRNSVDKPLYTAVPSTVCNVADTSPSDKVFPFALEFLSLNNAIILSFSWSVMLQCLDTIDKLHSLQQKHVEDPPSMREMLDDTDSTSVTWSAHQQGLSETVAMYQYRLPANSSSNNFGDAKWPSIEFIKSEANRLARYLCQSMEYSHRPQLGMLATQSVTYPAWTARQHFRQHGMEKEHAWTGHMKDMTGPNFRSGTIMKFRDMN